MASQEEPEGGFLGVLRAVALVAVVAGAAGLGRLDGPCRSRGCARC